MVQAYHVQAMLCLCILLNTLNTHGRCKVHMLLYSKTQDGCVLQLLQYHVVPGMAMTVDMLTDGQTLPTALTGQNLKVSNICSS